MFEQLLRYHRELDPTEAVRRFTSHIKRQFWMRHAILSSFTIAGILMAIWALSYFNAMFPSNIWSFLIFEQSYGMVYASIVIGAVLVGILWLFNDDMERL